MIIVISVTLLLSKFALTCIQLHFFYYELGPCLAYLQELLGNIEECQPSFTNQLAGDTDTVTMEMDCDGNIDNIDEGQYDQVAVLHVNQMSNDAMQVCRPPPQSDRQCQKLFY